MFVDELYVFGGEKVQVYVFGGEKVQVPNSVSRNNLQNLSNNFADNFEKFSKEWEVVGKLQNQRSYAAAQVVKGEHKCSVFVCWAIVFLQKKRFASDAASKRFIVITTCSQLSCDHTQWNRWKYCTHACLFHFIGCTALKSYNDSVINLEIDRYIGPPILSDDIWPFEYRPI